MTSCSSFINENGTRVNLCDCEYGTLSHGG